MKISDVKDCSDLIIFVSASIRIIISYPFRFIALVLGFPNTKIVWKSGHTEYYFFRNIKMTKTGDTLKNISWEAVTNSTPFYIGMEEIESIHTIY